MTRREEQANALYDFAVEKPDGFTYEEAMEAVGLRDRTKFYRVVRDVRMALGSDSIQLTCDPQGTGEPWLYKLVGQVEEGSPWIANRERDMQTRLATVHAVASSLVASTDGRTTEGRRARLVQGVIGGLLVQLDELAATAR